MRRWLYNVFRLGLKEFASLASDAILVFFIVYSFSFAIYSQATGIKTDVANAPVAIVDSDRSELSARFRDSLLKPYFRNPAIIDRTEVDRRMDRGAYTLVLDIPPRLEADALHGRSSALQLNIDATAMTQAGVGASYIEAIVQRETRSYLRSRGIDSSPPVSIVIRSFFNPNLEGVRLQAVWAILERFTMLSILIVGAAVIRERERGTIEHLLVMPIRASEIAAAKIWANGLVMVVACGLALLLVVQRLLDVPIEGSISLFLGGTAIYFFAVAALGVLLATIANTLPQFTLLAIPVFLILNLLSGGFSPFEAIPEPLQVVLQISPTVHYVKFAQSVLFRSAGIDVVWHHLVILIAAGALFLALAVARFRTMLTNAQ
ncbi:ABC transporter permease [Bradyrhizobium sp.]|uniref:ABC transporter permease n=1 Tax=Bradyrhizobium sp. TaxID=376 RepID=UPI003C767F37